jgi:hypothetical protein
MFGKQVYSVLFADQTKKTFYLENNKITYNSTTTMAKNKHRIGLLGTGCSGYSPKSLGPHNLNRSNWSAQPVSPHGLIVLFMPRSPLADSMTITRLLC